MADLRQQEKTVRNTNARSKLKMTENAVATVPHANQNLFAVPNLNNGKAANAAPQKLTPLVSKAQAEAFIQAVTGSPGTSCTWQTFGECDAKKDNSLRQVFSGAVQDVWDRLVDFNARGAGIFVTVNETDGKGRKEENLVRVRALFIDCDGGLRPEKWHLQPSIIVQSVHGSHAYWVVNDCSLDTFTDFQKRLAAHYGSDEIIHDIGRVMRVPGFAHKKAVPTAVTLESAPGTRYAAAEVMAGIPQLPPPPPAKSARKAQGLVRTATANDIGLDVVEIFEAAGLYRRHLEEGKHAVICPWEKEHTVPDYASDSGDTSTVIWEATAATPATFKCSHAHCDGKKLADVLKFLGTPTAADRELERLNKRYTYVESLDMVWDSRLREFVQPKALKMRGASERQWLSPAYDGKRTTANSPIFEPNKDRVPAGRLNLYDPTVILPPTGFAISPENQLRLQLFSRLLDNLAEGNAEDAAYIARWLAFAVRNPGKKSVALVLRGVGGSGKGLLAEICRKIFGRYAVGIGHEQLESRFNPWLSECVLGLPNEISAASFRDKVSAESKLKALVTEEMVTIERKGKDTYETPNYAKFLFMANDRVPLIINPEDRRYSVVASGWKLADKDPQLIDAIVEATKDPTFIQLVVDHLHALSLDTFNPHLPHSNAARDAVISDGLSGPERWWAEEMPPAGRYPSLAIYMHYRQWCEKTGERCMPSSALMRDRPESVRLLTARTDALGSRKLQALVGAAINAKCVDISDIGQGGTRGSWITSLTMPVGVENSAALAEAIAEMADTAAKASVAKPKFERCRLRAVDSEDDSSPAADSDVYDGGDR